MAYAQPQAWYVHAGNGSTTGYYAVPQYANQAWSAGQLVRPLTAPPVGSERVYVCTVAGTSTAEPTWTYTKGALQNATGGVTFAECTGEPGVNGDLTNCLQWTASSTPALGRVIYDPSSSSLQICTTSAAGAATKPSFSVTAGVITSDGATCKWTSLGPASNFTPWSAPHARLNNASATGYGVGGNDFYLADNSAETTSATVAYNIGTVPIGPCRVMSVDHTQPLPATASTLKPGASLASSSTTAPAVQINGGTATETYWYGVIFIASGAAATGLLVVGSTFSSQVKFEACSFQLTGGTSGASINVGCTSQYTIAIDLINCTFSLSNSGQQVLFGGTFVTWRSTPDPCFLGTISTAALRTINTCATVVLIEGVDFTSLGSNTLFSTTAGNGYFTIKNCKLHSGPLVQAFNVDSGAHNIDLVNCDSGANYYRNERWNIFGTLTTSATVTRSGGATDGTTPISHSIASSSYSRSWKPFNALPLVIWNNLVGATRTVTLYGIVLGTTNLPFNDQFWFEVFYMGSATSPDASMASNGLPTQLTPHSQIAVADSVSVWSGAGATKAPFSLSLTLTAQQKGYLTIYPKAGTSFSLYLDPLPVLS